MIARSFWKPSLCLTAFLLFAVALLFAACSPRHSYTAAVFDEPLPASEIIGVQHTGEPFHLSDYEGELTLLFFGYTFCPDICPMTLANVAAAYRDLGEESARLTDDINVVFVSVDPERDLPERLAEYVPRFHSDFLGVFVSDEDLGQVKSEFGIFAEKRDVAADSAAGYLVDHTAGIYVVDREGYMRALFSHDTAPDDLVADLKALLRR